jgi:hypothetical protein
MLRSKSLLALLMLTVALTGCTSITNLTPSQQPRNAAGLYPVEILWKSNRQNIRKETLAPIVQVGFETYPMRPANMVSNRWETLIPVPVGTNYVNYRVRMDFDYNDIPVPRRDSRLSPTFQLQIKDK